MSKTVTLRVNEKNYQTFLEAARAENRPISNLIETAAISKIREQQFVDDLEMAEIRDNESLLKRIKKGSREAKGMKGDFVE